jgi:hypothetical protein
MQTVIFQGSTFNRQVEMLGDVEKITWFQKDSQEDDTLIEVYNSELSTILEDQYIESCVAELIPVPFFI